MRPNPKLLAFADRKRLRFTIFFGVMTGICSISISYWLSVALDGAFLEMFSLHQLEISLSLVFAFAVARTFFNSLQQFHAGHLAAQAKSHIRSTIIDNLRNDSRAIAMTRFMRGVESLDPWYAQYLPQAFIAMIVPTLILIVAAIVDPLSALVFLVTAPLLPLFLALIGMTAKRKSDEHWNLLAQQGNLYLETLVGLKTLRQYGRSNDWGHTLSQSAEILRKATMGILRLAFLSAFVLEMVGTIGTAIIAVEIGLRLLHGALPYQHALLVLLLAPEFYLPLRQLGLRAHASMEGEAIAKDIFPQSIDKNSNYIQGVEITHKLSNFATSLLTPQINKSPLSTPTLFVMDLFIRWPGQQISALQGLSFSVPAGCFVAIAGASGSGKSTLFAALLGHVSVAQGELVCNSRKTVWIPQQPKLMHRTLRENLWLEPKPSTERDALLWLALAEVGLDEFVRNLPEGLDTLAGEEGIRFSGGQARRLCLARAFLEKPDLVLLDEPEAHLDAHSVAFLETALAKVNQATRIIVSHRPETLAHADRVLFLAKGRAQAFATHAELMQSSEAYRNLLQASETAL